MRIVAGVLAGLLILCVGIAATLALAFVCGASEEASIHAHGGGVGAVLDTVSAISFAAAVMTGIATMLGVVGAAIVTIEGKGTK